MALKLAWKEVVFMKINYTYPSLDKSNFKRQRLLKILKWPFLVSAYASLIVNICVGGPWWCVIVIASLFMIWNLLFSIDSKLFTIF